MTLNTAMAIIAVVKKDPVCIQRITSNMKIFPAPLAGWGRDAYYMIRDAWNESAKGEMDPERLKEAVEARDMCCVGISEAAAIAITNALKNNDATLKNIKNSKSQMRNTETEHNATFIEMLDGQTHVFDWWATMDIDNPVMFASTRDFDNSTNSVEFSDFKGWK